MSYFCWGCRRNLTLITLGSERVTPRRQGGKVWFFQQSWTVLLLWWFYLLCLTTRRRMKFRGDKQKQWLFFVCCFSSLTTSYGTRSLSGFGVFILVRYFTHLMDEHYNRIKIPPQLHSNFWKLKYPSPLVVVNSPTSTFAVVHFLSEVRASAS